MHENVLTVQTSNFFIFKALCTTFPVVLDLSESSATFEITKNFKNRRTLLYSKEELFA